MRRGEVWWVNFEPSVGGEIRKKRPALIISNDTSNKYLNRVQVIAITSKIDKLYPSEAYVVVKGKQNKVMSDQITTVSKKRLINKVGKISESDIKNVETAISIQLGLSQLG